MFTETQDKLKMYEKQVKIYRKKIRMVFYN